jgi:hypothetical protein
LLKYGALLALARAVNMFFKMLINKRKQALGFELNLYREERVYVGKTAPSVETRIPSGRGDK